MVSIVWRVFSNPAPYKDAVYGLCMYGDTLYAVGVYEPLGSGRQKLRVEARYRDDGSIRNTWVSDDYYNYGVLHSCIAFKNRVYVVGSTPSSWSLSVFTLELGLINFIVFDEFFKPFSMTTDGHYLYVAGVSRSEKDIEAIRILKISPDDLTIVSEYSSTPMNRSAYVYSIVYEPRTKLLIIGGCDTVDEYHNWRIEILSTDLELVRVIRPKIRKTISGLSIGIDGIYAVGKNAILKINIDGSIITENNKLGGVQIYTSPTASGSLGNNIAIIDNNVIYIVDRTLKMRDSLRLARGVENIVFNPGNPAYDDRYLYIAGTAINLKDDWSWTIMAIDPRPRRRFGILPI